MKKISIAEPVTELKRIKIVDNGEPLVDYLEFCPRLVKANPVFEYRYETVVRESVARKLCMASKVLPNGYRIGVLEGWRPHHIQRRMYLLTWNRFKELHPEWGDAQLRRVVNRFTAPMNNKVPPPHSTGAAVDLYLLDSDLHELNMRAPYPTRDSHSFPFEAKGLTELSKERRRILADALLAGGMTNYPSEYWHWSYGDQGWAYRTGAPNAIYNVVEPQGYVPDERDVTDDPVVWIRQD